MAFSSTSTPGPSLAGRQTLVQPSTDQLPLHPSSSSFASDAGAGVQERIDLNVPTNLLILPASAALVGLVIGMSRGGSRARLRFLAENAHRPPKTIQGWYFYTKTRNYRVFFSAAKMGTKYALGLGAATASFVLLDEGAGWVRERLFGVEPITGRGGLDRKGKGRATDPGSEVEEEMVERRLVARKGWRDGPVHWEDGAAAGMTMGFAVGLIYSLPRALFLRALIMGTLLGGATSALQSAQDYVGRLRIAQELHEPRLSTALPPAERTAAGTIRRGTEEMGDGREVRRWEGRGEGEGMGRVGVEVDRPVQPGDIIRGPPVDETVSASASGEEVKEGRGWLSLIPGMGR